MTIIFMLLSLQVQWLTLVSPFTILVLSSSGFGAILRPFPCHWRLETQHQGRSLQVGIVKKHSFDVMDCECSCVYLPWAASFVPRWKLERQKHQLSRLGVLLIASKLNSFIHRWLDFLSRRNFWRIFSLPSRWALVGSSWSLHKGWKYVQDRSLCWDIGLVIEETNPNDINYFAITGVSRTLNGVGVLFERSIHSNWEVQMGDRKLFLLSGHLPLAPNLCWTSGKNLHGALGRVHECLFNIRMELYWSIHHHH